MCSQDTVQRPSNAFLTASEQQGQIDPFDTWIMSEEAQTAPEQQTEAQLEAVPLTPPADCIQVTEDGGVLKHVVAEGSGDLPVRHGRCLVHYIGRCIPSGEVFMNTKEETQGADPIVVVAGRDSATRETGLFQAVATMRPGERSLVYIMDHKYGYGAKGSFSFPSVPPACQLVYDVTMITCEPPDEDRDRRTMLFEERLEAAERRKMEGNALFADGKYKEALAKYALAMSYCDEDFMMQLQGPHLDKAEEVTDPIFLNMAAAQLKTGDYAMAAHNSTQILMRHPNHVKALFRRAKARTGLGRTEEALEDLNKATALDPDDKQIQKELRALRAVIKDEKAATAKLFKGSLGSAPKQQPSSEGSSYADGSSNNNSQAAGGSAAAGIDAAEAAAKPPAAAVAAVAQSSSRSLVPPLLAVLALVAAVLAFVFGWLPGAS